MPAESWIEHSKLWLVLDRTAAAPRSLADVTREAIAGGVDAVVCRIKDTSLEELAALAAPVREICRHCAVPFILSQALELAVQLEVDALHFGVNGPEIALARRVIGPNIALGYSAHSVAETETALLQGADYVFLGPVFPTPAKLRYGAPLGTGVIASALRLDKPVVFIGGINLETLPTLIAAGARQVAAIAALQSVPDVCAAAQALRGLLDAQ